VITTLRINTCDLQPVLEEIFLRPISRLSRRPSAYSSSFPIEEVEAEFECGAPICVIFKNVSPDALLDVASRVRPAFLYDPLREIQVYRSILPFLDLGTPKLYGAVSNPAIGRYWLFLEKVPGVELYEIGDFQVWTQVARWLARFHASARCEPERVRAALPQVLEYDAAFYWRWLSRAKALTGAKLGRLTSRYERIVNTLLGLPRRLIHGEFYASNILVHRELSLRVSPLDWEMAAIGPGILDLAAIVSGKWSREQRLQIANAYWSRLPSSLRPVDFVTAFDCCQLQIALQWLGWSEKWVAPDAHAHNWLAEALELIEGESLSRLLA
jgi:hypothetical protein